MDDPITSWLAAEDARFEFPLAAARLIRSSHPQLLIVATEDLSGVAIVADSADPQIQPSEEASQAFARCAAGEREQEAGELFPRMDALKDNYIEVGLWKELLFLV